MKAASGVMKGPWRAQAAWIEQALATSGGDFLFGKSPSIGDFSAYMNFWFLGGSQPGTVDDLTRGLDRVTAWRKRVAAIGHGKRTNITPADAIAVAKASEPSITVPHDPNDPSGISPGEAAVVMADDYGREPLERQARCSESGSGDHRADRSGTRPDASARAADGLSANEGLMVRGHRPLTDTAATPPS